jgi:hypothetical protein
VSKGSDTWLKSVEVATGLESYVDMNISSAAYFGLSDQTAAGGAWHLWSGQDIKSAAPDMCGRWSTDTDWRAAEHLAC